MVKRCTIQITVSCLTWCVSLLNMLMFLFLNQAQFSWLKRDLSKGKGKIFPDLRVIPAKYFAATQFCKPRIIGYPSSFALERFSISLLRCTGLLKAQLGSRKGENIPWIITPDYFFLCKVGWHKMRKENPSMVKGSRFYTDKPCRFTGVSSLGLPKTEGGQYFAVNFPGLWPLIIITSLIKPCSLGK